MRKLITWLFFTAIATQIGASDCGQVIRDPGFDVWCGEELCAWKVERGDIKRVPTWHDSDAGVELVGLDTAIAQLSPVDSADGHCRDLPGGQRQCIHPADVCIEFSLLANIDANAAVDLNIDVFADGTIDHTQRLPLAKWDALAYRIVIRKPFAGVRFQLAKAGSGTAQLANIGAQIADNCDGLPVIDPRPAPLGSPCETGGDCASGICGIGGSPTPFSGVIGPMQPNTVCVDCDQDHPCGTGSICGTGDALSPIRAEETVCVPNGSKELTETCTWFTECKSLRCTRGMCSTCKEDADCNGETCAVAWDSVLYSPSVCSPNQHRRQAGQPCVSHDDCASSVCVGTERSQCDDGRSCTTAAQCPFKSGLKNGPCTTVGIQGGSCQ